MGIPLTLSQVPPVTPYVQYIATNGQTVFPYPFPVTQDSDLVAAVNGVTLSTDLGYTLSGQGSPTGGNLTFTSGRTAGDIVTLFRDIAIERLTQIGQNSGFQSTAFNAEFNNIYLILQQLDESLSFTLQVPNTNNPAPVTTLLPTSYANKFLAFDSFGNPTPAVLTSSGSLTASILGGLLNPQTTAEAAALVTPADETYPPYNVKRYGALLGNSSAQNLAALNRAISVAQHDSSAAALNGVVITIPADCHYGYNFLTQSTWPQINSGTVPILVIDYSQGDTYDTYPTRYDGTQVREFIYTPQTTSSGQHNGNGKILYGNWHPYLLISNTEVNANPTVNALDNLRASIFIGDGTNYGTWRIGQGTLAGANLIPSQLRNFCIQSFPVTQVFNLTGSPLSGATTATLSAVFGGQTQTMAAQFANPNGDIRGVLFTQGSASISWSQSLSGNCTANTLTVGITPNGGTPLTVDYTTSNLYFNTGSNASTANYHFKQPVTGFNLMMLEGLSTVSDIVLRNGTGSSADVVVRNNGGNYELLFPGSTTPCVSINGSTKVQQVTGAFYPATPAGGQQSTSAMYAGSGVPSNSNGNNGDFYFRGDTPGTLNQRIYVKAAGSWTAIL